MKVHITEVEDRSPELTNSNPTEKKETRSFKKIKES